MHKCTIIHKNCSSRTSFKTSLDIIFHLWCLVYLFWFRYLYWVDSFDLDLIFFLPRGTLGWHPLDNGNPCWWLYTGCFRRRLRPWQYNLLWLWQELWWIIRGYWWATIFFSLRPGEHMTPTTIRHVTTKDAGDKSSWRRAGSITCHRVWGWRWWCRTVAAKGFWGCRTVIISLVPIYWQKEKKLFSIKFQHYDKLLFTKIPGTVSS